MARNILVGVLFLSVLPLAALAQKDRLSGPIDRNRTVVLRGNLHPQARAEFDQGPVDPGFQLHLITLMLKPSAAQQAALEQLLRDQQDPSSSNYHHWLTPEEYADRFGLSPADIGRVVSWLQSEGFTVDDVARSRNWIVFHASARQVQNALHTEIHRYRADGKLQFANSIEPSIPAALEPLVAAIRGLDDFRLKPAAISDHTALPAPDYTSSTGTSHYLAPDDYATIYDIGKLYAAGYDGTGQKIVIAGQSAIDLSDFRLFRSTYNLPDNNPQVILVPGSTDPGIVSGDVDEANLDMEWSGAVARNASLIYVYANDHSGGVEASVRYAVNQNLAPVISFSYGICEPQASASSAASVRIVAQQANAQGITWFASSGDSGAAGCDTFDRSTSLATQGLSVSFPASLPEVTGVGGTEFNDTDGTYWRSANSPSGESAMGYIPEIAWNEPSSGGLGSSGGGLSTLYSKPSWQTGPGVPSANARAVPDVSLSAGLHDSYLVFTGGSTSPRHFGGTSAGTPAFAGLVALLNQFEVSNGIQPKPGQGNINPNLYRLAQSSSNAFHDITSGSNIVPCSSGTPDCSGGSFGYNAGPGYDLATGLGSVDATNLINQWSGQVVVSPMKLSGISNGASFTLTSASLAPGSIAAIFGSNLTDGSVCVPPNCGPGFDANGKIVPFMAGAQVTFNSIPAPILSTPGSTQLNVQVPIELAGNSSANVQVTANGQSTPPSTIPLAQLSPGLISINSNGSGQGAILNDRDANAGIQSLVAPSGSAPNAHPAAAGDVIEIYGTGLGAVTPAVPTGMRPQSLSQTVVPSVTIGGMPATVLFSGLAGCCVGLNQVNVIVPAGISPSDSVPLVLTVSGVTSNTVTIAVQ